MRSPIRRVTFEDDEMDRPRNRQMRRPNLTRVGSPQESFSESFGDYRSYPRQDARGITRNTSRSPGIRKREVYREIYIKSPSETANFAQPMGFQPQQQYQQPPPQPGGKQNHGKPHRNLMFCPANSQQCFFCGKFGRFHRCCKTQKNE